LATGNALEDLTFKNAISPQSTGIIALEMLTAWQTDDNYMNIAQYQQQNIHYFPLVCTIYCVNKPSFDQHNTLCNP
jgi:hypothetical protein